MKLHRGRIVAAGLGFLVALAIVLAALASTANADTAPSGQTRAPAAVWFNCIYIVRPGDTLFSIAARYGVSPYALAQGNGLWNPSYIYAGMRIWVPCQTPPPRYPTRTVTPCANAATYLVKPGDNLFRIAFNYGTTVAALRDANNLWGRVLRPGMELRIPCPTGNNPTPTPTPPPDLVAPSPTPLPGVPTTVPPPANAPSGNLPPEPSAQISLGVDAVDPAAATIKVNQSVVWINNSNTTYTVQSGFPGQPNNLFKSDPLPAGGTYVFTFTTLGNYSYFVVENPTLVGQVNVSP